MDFYWYRHLKYDHRTRRFSNAPFHDLAIEFPNQAKVHAFRGIHDWCSVSHFRSRQQVLLGLSIANIYRACIGGLMRILTIGDPDKVVTVCRSLHCHTIDLIPAYLQECQIRLRPLTLGRKLKRALPSSALASPPTVLSSPA